METLPPAMTAGTATIDPELRRRIEEHAYSLWEADGRPEGRALEYWLRAEEAITDQPLQDAPRPKGARVPRSRASENRLATNS